MEKKIKILHITQVLSGGVERYLQQLLRHLDPNRYENYVLISHASDRSAYEGLTKAVLQTKMYREIGLHDLVSVYQVRKIIKQVQPDIIYAHSSKAGAIARLANIGLNKSCIYNPHGWAFNMRGSPKKQMFYALVERMLTPLCQKIICISETEKESALSRRICREDKLQVILNGVDIAAYGAKLERNRDCTELGIPENSFVIGMVGRVSQQKAPDIFIKAAEKIKENIPNAFFVIVGNGEMEAEVQQFAAEHGLLDSLLITGWVNNPVEYIQCFDVAMLLSRWEGFGLALVEYMLAKKPIVATEVDAIPELIQHGENGLLVAPDDYIGAADAVLKLHNNDLLREKLRKNAYERAKRYDIRRVAQEHDVLFQNSMKLFNH